MINKLLKILFGKELILYNPHRNSNPLVNENNQEKYIFLNFIKFWRATAVAGRKSKLRYKLFYGVLTFLDPVYIIDINWITKLQSLYLVWCNNHGKSFVVVQHGIFDGGRVIERSEKYVKCNIYLVWGNHFKEIFEKNNRGKDFRCINFGNPCYNAFERSKFFYKEQIGNKVLLAVSVVKGRRLRKVKKLLKILNEAGYNVTVKEHALQSKLSKPINNHNKITGSLYSILKAHDYDLIITDKSTVMLDTIYFKNRAIYFFPENENEDSVTPIYSKFLKNLAYDLDKINTTDFLMNYVNIEAQEKLLDYLIKTENSTNDLSQIEQPNT